MDDAEVKPLTLQRNVILGLLLALAAASWALLVWQSAGPDVDMAMNTLTMGLRAPLFLTTWMVMMVAMMFPSAAPMILTFHRVQARRRQLEEAFISTWAFVSAYLLVWTLVGIAAYCGALAAENLAPKAALSSTAIARVGGVALIAAGLYQFTPLKGRCLSKCRSPLSFIMTSWREGITGALRMGMVHGAYCLGCCWLLFVILFPLGIMNLAVMVALTLVIFAEKSLPWGHAVARATAAVLVVYGMAVIGAPHLLPTFSAPSTNMPTDMRMSADGFPARRVADNRRTAWLSLCSQTLRLVS